MFSLVAFSSIIYRHFELIKMSKSRFQKIGAEKRTPCECEFCWSWFYVPRSKPQFLHVVEAMADSAAVLLDNAMKNIEKNPDQFDRQISLVFDRLNRIKSGSRQIIQEMPGDNILRCNYRKSKRERCHLPLTDDGKCPDHGDQTSEDLGRFFG